jgi:S-formylglutathione hydrolase FrmB
MKRWIGLFLLVSSVLAAIASAADGSSPTGVTVHQWVTPGGPYVSRREMTKLDVVDGKLVTNIVLPADYSSRKCWPVLYLLHGTADSSQPVSLQWLQIDNGELLKMHIPAILVIPGSGDSWWVNNWWGDYRHPAWESWLLQDILPMVAKRLHVCPGRSEHAIAGLSMGGYGAIYLATQRPDYFGAAGSFSGVLSPESPNFISIYPTFKGYWGPPDKFYAIGHDPLALVDNLQHTRVFVGAGNGIPTVGESTNPTAEFEEAEFDQESIAFADKARSAGVSVHFDQHAGSHDPLNWLLSLTHMLEWNPFKPIVQNPSSWKFYTVESTGTAWGWGFSFHYYARPDQMIEFSLSHGVFSARGGGSVTITTPHGQALTGEVPFNISNGHLYELSSAPKPNVVGGYEKLIKVTPTVTKRPTTAAEPMTVQFRTKQPLPRNQEYQVDATEFSLTGAPSSCQDQSFARVFQPAAGRVVSVTLSAASTASTPGVWCSGPHAIALTEVSRNGPSRTIGNIIGYAFTSVP